MSILNRSLREVVRPIPRYASDDRRIQTTIYVATVPAAR